MGMFRSKKSSVNGDARPVTSSSRASSTATTRTPNRSAVSSPITEEFTFPSITLPRAPDPLLNPAAYLRSIHAVRERSKFILTKAKRNQLNHFNVDMTKFGETARYVVSIIKRDYGTDYGSIPSYGKWQHFEVGGRPRIDLLMESWPISISVQERTRKLIDLFLVSALLDAGAGVKWQYKSKESGRVYRRSEGLAVAVLESFKAGLFSSDPNEPCQVDSIGLGKLTVGSMAKALQVTEHNPIEGLEGRTSLLLRLAGALKKNLDIFGVDARPGNMLDYLLSHPSTQASSVPVVPLPVLWDILMEGLAPIWPVKTKVDGISVGDAWPCLSMPVDSANPCGNIVPFHKLTQWLCYSLMVPMTKLMHIHFAGVELLTGLPEYRNGGLLIDTGLLTLKPEDAKRGLNQFQANALKHNQPSMEVVPLFSVDDDVVIEWRALTVGFVDDLAFEVNSILGLVGDKKLSLAQILEAGTCKGGRELAEVSRPNTREPPIMTLSGGTVM